MNKALSVRSPSLTLLKKRADFLRVAQGRRHSTPGFVVQMARQPQDMAAPPRIGFTVSRKVGNAVIRNRVRRRLKAAARQVFFEAAQAGCDYVVVARRPALTRPFECLLDDLRGALIKLGQSQQRPRPSGGNTAGTSSRPSFSQR